MDALHHKAEQTVLRQGEMGERPGALGSTTSSSLSRSSSGNFPFGQQYNIGFIYSAGFGGLKRVGRERSDEVGWQNGLVCETRRRPPLDCHPLAHNIINTMQCTNLGGIVCAIVWGKGGVESAERGMGDFSAPLNRALRLNEEFLPQNILGLSSLEKKGAGANLFLFLFLRLFHFETNFLHFF